MVKYAAHNGRAVGSNPTAPNVMRRFPTYPLSCLSSREA